MLSLPAPAAAVLARGSLKSGSASWREREEAVSGILYVESAYVMPAGVFEAELGRGLWVCARAGVVGCMVSGIRGELMMVVSDGSGVSLP